MCFRSTLLVFMMMIPALNLKAQWKPADNPLFTPWSESVTTGNVWQEYPRPQMVRQKWLNLNGLWDYAIRPKEEDMPNQYDGKILVPFPVESALSGVKKPVGEKNKLWYRKSFELPADWSGFNTIIRFEAVDWEMSLWVNGKHVSDHRGGYDRISSDITPFLKKEGPQEVVLSVWDPVDSGTQPRGKQVMDPSGIWYTSVTGIWQTVWLEPLPRQHIGYVKVITNFDKDSIAVKVTCINDDKTMRFHARVMDHDTQVSEGVISTLKPLLLPIPGAKHWSPDSPFLYDLKIELLDSNDHAMDSISSYFGMRKISVAKDSEGLPRIMLNNKFVFQFGFLDQGWWPDGLYTAPSDEALRYDIEMTKKMGFNLARKHVKVEPERWYYWCDKLGLLVWQDMPSGDAFIGPQDRDIVRTPSSANQFAMELNALMRGKYNHPCIVVWVPFNEGWGQYNTDKVSLYINYEDPSRLVDAASGWVDRKMGNINDIHAYPGPAMPDPEKNRAIVLGEFGGLGLPVEGHTWQLKDNWGYRNLKDTADLARSYAEFIGKLLPMKRKGLSAAVYTQTTDVEGEVNGLMTYDRKFIKIDPQKLTRINAGYVAPSIEYDNSIFLLSNTVSLFNDSPSGVIRYTTNGTDPVVNSSLYTVPLILQHTTQLKARTFWPDGTRSPVTSAEFKKVKIKKGKTDGGFIQGIPCRYFENQGERWSVIPDWKYLVPKATDTVAIVNNQLKKREEDYGFVFDGYIKIAHDGVYTFYLDTDDGSKLFIDNRLVLDHDGVHGTMEKNGEAPLGEGFHKIRVEYFQGTGGSGLTLRLKSPGGRKQEVSADMLYHTVIIHIK